MFDILVVGCGLSGMIVARELAEKGKKVHIIEKRNHIGGNIYDYYDENGILVQKYGPHVFFTDNPKIEEYLSKFVAVEYFYAECKTYIDGKAIPIPFNFESIDLIYTNKDYANELKSKLISEFGLNAIVSVVDVINCKDEAIHQYGEYMFEHEYRKYSAKQWGKPIESIDSSVFLRVPVYISDKKSYLCQKYQYMPKGGFTVLAEKILDHPNITVELGCDAIEKMKISTEEGNISYGDFKGPILFTGPLDGLFAYKYGHLPYRALEFSWKVINKCDAPITPLSAFPEGDKYIRITDYTQFPPQDFGDNSVIAIEFPVEYKFNELCGNEPYYPTLTEESKIIFDKYSEEARTIKGLYWCGRLAEFKYYNMDDVILNAIEMSQRIEKEIFSFER